MNQKPYESPKLNKMEGGEYEAFVFESFHNLGFKIEEIKPLYKRLIELETMEKSHFEDAVHMAKMVDEIWPKLETELKLKCTKEQLKLACLFHDIGKSGPLEANDRQRHLIQMLFNPDNFNPKSKDFEGVESVKDLTIGEALDRESKISDQDKMEIRAYLSTLEIHIDKEHTEKLDLNKHTMIDFWREHDQWTADLLEEYKDSKISSDVIDMASSHHLTENRDPRGITKRDVKGAPAVELLDRYLMITIIDKYQAWIGRSGRSHAEAIAQLEKDIARSLSQGFISEIVAEKYRKCLDIIASSENLSIATRPQKTLLRNKKSFKN